MMSKINHIDPAKPGGRETLARHVARFVQQDWGNSPAEIGGIYGCGAAVAIAELSRAALRPIVVVVPGSQHLEALTLDFATLAPELRVIECPDEEVSDGDHRTSLVAWLPVLAELSGLRDNEPAAVVATATSLLASQPNDRLLKQATIALTAGAILPPETLLARLSDAGFDRVQDVDQPGQFSRRGGIVDLWPHALPQPIRIEYFDREIESLRSFDPATQRSVASMNRIAFPLLAFDQSNDNDGTGLLNHLPPGTLPVMIERRDSLARIENLRPFFGHRQARISALLDWMGETPRLDMTREPVMERRGALNVGSSPFILREAGADGAIAALTEIACTVDRISVYAGSEGEAKRFADMLRASKLPPGRIDILPNEVSGGCILPQHGVAMLSGAELLGKHKLRGGIHVHEPTILDTHHRAIDDFVQLETNDYVVHAAHGIGRFRGIEELRTPDGARAEYLRIEFDGRTEIHVPVAHADQVQKYIGARGAAPKLSRYNSQSWAERKGRVQQAVIQLAADMLKLQATRELQPGHAFPPADDMEHDFVESFPYRDTPDQEKAWGHISTDLESARPCDRLICGDVGFGKTELAMRAAFKVAAAGKQVAVLVPTTVLCQQHWLSFSSRMAGFPVRVESLSRFRTDREQTDVIRGIKEGSVDVVIGTHRLLSKDVEFKDLGLVVIDEEQRFGVEAKERLKRLRATVDMLTLTATPIPRTLHMSLVGIRDITSLTTPPNDRHPVHTQTMAFDERQIREAVLRELARDGQVYFVHNRVRDIDEVAERIRRIAPEARVVVGHGQMADGELETVMLAFINHKADVLVCTTIIESGIDVQSANTMFINHAHTFGLADLHQLRGRVGRYRHHAYCYLIVPRDVEVREDATKRLDAIMRHTRLGSGFHIAMQDLEIRGAGNILGAEQSGHIASVGYDMYCQLLQKAVAQLKGGEILSEVETTIELDLDLVLPKEYVKEAAQRVHVYRLIGRCANTEQADETREALRDRFGALPPTVERLVTLALLRHRLGRLGVTSLAVGAQSGNPFFRLKAISARATLERFATIQKDIRLLDDDTLVLPFRSGLKEPDDRLRYWSNLMQSMVTRGILREAQPAPEDLKTTEKRDVSPLSSRDLRNDSGASVAVRVKPRSRSGAAARRTEGL